ncbi:MAG: PAS domain-containing protein [Gemmatimonadaceae bacterium]|nr:PAS domain-containing protein [Gemmatimonadaceae bacterium]
MSFVPSSFVSQLPNISRSSADAAPFGIVQVDDNGVIQLYNRWEQEMGGIPASSAEGRNFFTQVAPCTNNRLVFGKFKEGVAAGSMDAEFNYTFTYKMKPTNVTLRIIRHAPSRTNWVLVGKRAA